MPVYHKSSNGTRIYDGVTIKKGDNVVAVFIPESEDVTKVSEEPLVASDVLASGTLTNAALSLPYAKTISVSVYSAAGATVYFADDSNGVALAAGQTFTHEAPWCRTGKIRVEGTVAYAVERRK